MEIKIEDLLRRHEGKTLEFKRDLSSPKKILRTLVAFANTSGGVLLIGVDDGTKSVRGVKDPLAVEALMANIISDGIAPTLLPGIEFLAWRNTQVIAVDVAPGPARPYFVKNEGKENGVYVRVGSSNRAADQALIGELRRVVTRRTYDESPAGRSGVNDLDTRAVHEIFAPHRKIRTADLETLGILTREGRELIPTVGGLLLFGGNRARDFPDAWLQCGRFEGDNRAKVLDTVECHDPLPLLPERAIDFFRKHATLAYEIRGVRRKERWSVPIPALREAAINAFVHADYARAGGPIRVACFDRRIEIENPGILPFGLATENLTQGVSVIRNRVIARVFKELKLIEQWGSGIRRMIETCREAGLPDPQFEEIGFRFRVSFDLRPTGRPQFDARDQAILHLLEQHQDGLVSSAIAAEIGLTQQAIRARLNRLVDQGMLVVLGQGLHDPRRRYTRTDISRDRS